MEVEKVYQQKVARTLPTKQGKGGALQFVDNRPKSSFPLQRLGLGHEEEEPVQMKRNNTGLPDNLKTGIENLSGFSMDNVRVYYNSSKPAQLQALAYTQGTDIHVAPGQERHLPHEAWHVVQQMQGRVRPTMQLRGVDVNDDEGLEREADRIGGMSFANNIVQRAVPTDYNMAEHPTPETVYKARGGEDIPFEKDKFPRSKFNFGSYTRNAVLSRFSHETIGNRIITVQDQASKQIVNVEGIQLDHSPTSWEHITEYMDSKNNRSNPYTYWEAKMYYNDLSNLHPVLGGLNSAAGDEGVKRGTHILEEKFPILNLHILTIQTAWMNLQNYIMAKIEEPGLCEAKLIGLLDFLKNITESIYECTEGGFEELK